MAVNQTLCYKQEDGKYVFKILERKDSTVNFSEMRDNLVQRMKSFESIA